jgi:hypothetical protein
MKTHLARFSTAFVLLFAADGVLSVTDELLGRLGGHGLEGPRILLASIVILAAAWMLLALVVFRTLPKRTLLPLIVFTGWAMGMAMPLPLLLGMDGAALAMSILQIALAAAVLLRLPRDGASWLVPVQIGDGPDVTLRHTAVTGAVVLFLAPIAMISYAGLSAQAAISHATNGYVHVDFKGLDLEERTLVRGDTTVRLIGMMHIGDADAYSDLYATFPEEGCLILTEGVTDEEGLLPHFSYDRFAEALGLKSQSDIGMSAGPPEDEPEEDPRVRHADVDVASFSDETLDVLRELAHVFSGPDLATIWERYLEAVERIDDTMVEAVMADLIDARNLHLLATIQAAIADTDLIIVPWGALHLSWIEEQLVIDGFEVQSSSRRDHIRFWD